MRFRPDDNLLFTFLDLIILSDLFRYLVRGIRIIGVRRGRIPDILRKLTYQARSRDLDVEISKVMFYFTSSRCEHYRAQYFQIQVRAPPAEIS